MSESFKEKLRSINFGMPSHRNTPKQTVDHTDDTINTVTEHYDGRQDLHVKVRHPVTNKKD